MKEPSAKFYRVLIIFLEVLKVRSLEGLDVSDLILENVHNMRYSPVHNILEQELIWIWDLRQYSSFFLVPFLFLCPLRFLYIEKL